MELAENILNRFNISKPQRKFLLILFTTILIARGKVNFRNLSRYSDLCQQTYSRQFAKPFDFVGYNRSLIDLSACVRMHAQAGETFGEASERILAFDPTFVPTCLRAARKQEAGKHPTPATRWRKHQMSKRGSDAMFAKGKVWLIVLVLLVIGFTVTASVERLKGDLNGDGQVNFADFVLLSQNFGKTGGATFDPDALVDTSVVNYRDTIAVTVVDTFWGFRVVRDTVERVVYQEGRPKQYPKIVVLPGGWNKPETPEITPEAIQTLCIGVMEILTEGIEYPLDSDIVIHYAEEGPKVYYDRYSDGDYIGAYKVALDVKSTDYGHLVFQFAHEYAHILSNYYRVAREGRQRWFEESLSALASLYALRKADAEWRENPPQLTDWTERYRNYARGRIFRLLAREFINSVPQGRRNLPVDYGLYGWYSINRLSLESDPYQRGKNRVVAFTLLDIFEENPQVWNTLRYLKTGPYNESEDFEDYLHGWYSRTPKQWQPLVSKIMKRLGFYFYPKPAVSIPTGQQDEQTEYWVNGSAYLPN